jgi:hypothetical protein
MGLIKKLFLAFVVVAVLAGPCLAAGSWSTPVKQTLSTGADTDPQFLVITATFTADASNGSVPDLSITDAAYGIAGYSLVMLLTDPGATAPTDNYDITVNEALAAGGSTVNTTDAMGSEGLDRDTSTSEQAVPLVGGVYGARLIVGDLTVSVANNSVNSATCAVALIFKK